MFGAVVSHQNSPSPMRSSVLAAWLLFLGLAGLCSARHPQTIHPGLPGVCRAIIGKVQSYTESNLQSSLVGVRGGICSWLELNGCQQYKVVFTPVYKIAFRTVYVNGFVCCSGYIRIGNACVPNKPVTVSPTSQATTPHRPPGNASPVTAPPSASDNDNHDGSSSVPGFTGLSMTARPVTPPSPSTGLPSTQDPNPERTPRTDVDPPPGPRDRLLIILLILVIVVALFAIASFAAHFAKLWRRGRLTCCSGVLSLPRIRTGRDSTDESSKMSNCILGTISSDCSTESVRSDLSDLSRRSGSDHSGQSGLSASSEVTFIDDSDSGIVKHVVYETCWKDTTSLLSYASSSGASQGSSSKVSALLPKKCTPLITIPLTPLKKKHRPSPPLPIRPDRIYDTTPYSPPSPLPLPNPKRSSPTRQPSPGPYSYTSLNKKELQNSSPNIENESPVGSELVIGPTRMTHEDVTLKAPSNPAYINVKLPTEKPRPIYVTLEPKTDSVALATECREGDDDPWITSHSPTSSPVRPVGYSALTNQVLPHRISGNGYDKLKRNRQNLPLAPEIFPGPEYAVPSVSTSTSCLVVETDTESQVSRASPDLRRSGTMPSVMLEYLKVSENVAGKNSEQEERYIRAPRHHRRELVFIDGIRRFQDKTPNSKHNSVG